MKTRFDFHAASVLLVAALACTSLAHAGECPSDQVGVNPLTNAPAAPVGVVDTEIASIDLSKENVMLEQRRLRTRHMTIQPGGVVPLHSHEDRPALIKVNAGEIYENNSKCKVPILHKAGDTAREFLGTRHWWKNEGTTVVDLSISDLVNDKKPETMKQQIM